MRARVVRTLRGRGGYTLIELLAVLTIFLTVVTALTTLFVRGARAELDANRRFQAQLAARTSFDLMRREIHCGASVTFTSAASVTVTLPASCPSAGGTQTTVVYDTASAGTNRYKLRRKKGSSAAVPIADYLTSANIFAYTAPTTTTLGRLTIDMPVNVYPNEAWKNWRLNADIVLRNSTRT
jgi:prepilin-type N-terminal cleavage/methylation domain-containing protein